MNTARKPTISTKTMYSMRRYISADANIVNTSMQSKYDWKSDQFQKYFISKSSKEKRGSFTGLTHVCSFMLCFGFYQAVKFKIVVSVSYRQTSKDFLNLIRDDTVQKLCMHADLPHILWEELGGLD